ncbi:MAG: hypothetical protein K6E99_00465 [Bacilli bacterium]|nr:hypothetical protein [Bacilli bacterium]
MYNQKILDKLEKILEAYDIVLTYLDYQSADMILERKKIVQYLDKLFENIDTVREEDINGLTTKKPLRSVVRLYLIRNNIAIIKEGKVALSDLSKDTRKYKNDISKNSKFDEEEIETALENKGEENINIVMNKLLNYVFTTLLESVTDEKMFEELLGEANETLLSSIYSYDKSKHNNFKQYLTYNLDILIINKQTKIINDGTYKSNFVYVDKYEDKIIERVDNLKLLKELIEAANLSIIERKVIDYMYGLTDGVAHTYDEVAREFKMNKMGAIQIQSGALNKLKKEKK